MFYFTQCTHTGSRTQNLELRRLTRLSILLYRLIISKNLYSTNATIIYSEERVKSKE